MQQIYKKKYYRIYSKYIVLLSIVFCTVFSVAVSVNAAVTVNSTKIALGRNALAGYWKFDDGVGSTTIDSSGANETGTLQSGQRWITGKFGKALLFDGASGDIDTTATTKSAASFGALTIGQWVNFTSLGGVQESIARTNGGLDYQTSGSFGLEYGECPGSAFMFHFNNYNDNRFCSSYTAYTPGVWYFLTATFDSSNGVAKFYVNGVLTDTTTYLASPIPAVGGGFFKLGGWKPGSSFPFYFNGALDDTFVYSKVISQADIAALYASKAPLFAKTATLSTSNKNVLSFSRVTVPHRYWRMIETAVTNGHSPRTAELRWTDSNGTARTPVSYVCGGSFFDGSTCSDGSFDGVTNTSDSGWISAVGGYVAADFGAPGYAMSKFEAWSSYGGGARGANWNIDYSDDASNWTTATSFNYAITGTGWYGTTFGSLPPLVTHYTFDGADVVGNKVVDVSGSGNNGTRMPQLSSGGAGGTGWTLDLAGSSEWNGNYIQAGMSEGAPYFQLDISHFISYISVYGCWFVDNQLDDYYNPSPAYFNCNYDPSSPATIGYAGYGGPNSPFQPYYGGWPPPTIAPYSGSSGGATANTWAVKGKMGQAMSFNGSTDYVAMASSSEITSNLSQISISAWIKIKTSGVWQGIVGAHGANGYHFQIQNDNHLQLYIYGPNASAVGSTDLSSYVGKWVHVVGTYDGSTIKVYVNGVLDGSTPATGAIANATDMRVGDTYDDTRFFLGAIDDVRIYNVALTSAQVAQLYGKQVSQTVKVMARALTTAPAQVELLVVGGGGSGGNNITDYAAGGGGGGGAVLYTLAYPITSGSSYTVTIGDGGVNTGGDSVDGQTSVFNDQIAPGGIGGGNGRTGGYGGDGGHAGTGGAGGHNGNGSLAGGGGGGANSNGIAPSGDVGGAGGNGIASSITGSLTYYGGGGGGGAGANFSVPDNGAGGLGGGGPGGSSIITVDTNGVANTGGGGGGIDPVNSNQGAGGSGVVIIAYPGTTAKATGGIINTTSRPGYVVHTFTSSGVFHVN